MAKANAEVTDEAGPKPSGGGKGGAEEKAEDEGLAAKAREADVVDKRGHCNAMAKMATRSNAHQEAVTKEVGASVTEVLRRH